MLYPKGLKNHARSLRVRGGRPRSGQSVGRLAPGRRHAWHVGSGRGFACAGAPSELRPAAEAGLHRRAQLRRAARDDAVGAVALCSQLGGDQVACSLEGEVDTWALGGSGAMRESATKRWGGIAADTWAEAGEHDEGAGAAHRWMA